MATGSGEGNSLTLPHYCFSQSTHPVRNGSKYTAIKLCFGVGGDKLLPHYRALLKVLATEHIRNALADGGAASLSFSFMDSDIGFLTAEDFEPLATGLREIEPLVLRSIHIQAASELGVGWCVQALSRVEELCFHHSYLSEDLQRLLAEGVLALEGNRVRTLTLATIGVNLASGLDALFDTMLKSHIVEFRRS